MPAVVILGLVAALLFGVSIGSFLNVVIWRIPQGLSVGSPTWSFCPNCKTRLQTADLIPLLSFLALGRKCRYCKQPISWRYFTVEAVTGLLFLAVAWRNFGPVAHDWNLVSDPLPLLTAATTITVFQCLFVAVMVAIFFIDLDTFTIPNRLPFAAFLIGCGMALAKYWLVVSGLGTHRALVTGAGVWHTLLPVLISAAAYAAAFHLISLLGYIYYTAQRGDEYATDAEPVKRLPLLVRVGHFLLGVVEDYAYLLARILGLKYLFAPVRRFVEAQDALMAYDPAEADASREDRKAEIENDDEQTGMGQGDAKLAGAIGANLLFPMVLVSFFAAVVSGGVISILMMLVFRARGRTAIPFGPYLVAGALFAMFFGQPLWDWYMALYKPPSPTPQF